MEWISIKDGLPDEGSDVLSVIENVAVVMSNFNHGMFEVKKYPCPSDRVLIAYWEGITHWMPLPSPPKQ